MSVGLSPYRCAAPHWHVSWMVAHSLSALIFNPESCWRFDELENCLAELPKKRDLLLLKPRTEERIMLLAMATRKWWLQERVNWEQAGEISMFSDKHGNRRCGGGLTHTSDLLPTTLLCKNKSILETDELIVRSPLKLQAVSLLFLCCRFFLPLLPLSVVLLVSSI